MMKKIKSGITIFVAPILFFIFSNSLYAERWDLLTIESIENVKPAGGVDGVLLDFVSIVETIIRVGKASAEIYASDGTSVTSYVDIVNAVSSGDSQAQEVLTTLDNGYSGQDDLIVQVNGQSFVPEGQKFFPIEAGQIIQPNIQVSFKNKIRISLIEYDSGSDNDDLGNVIIDMNKAGSKNRWEKIIITAPAAEDGSIYYVTARVDIGQGDKGSTPQWLKCGTAQCVECLAERCSEHDSSGLDRDGDKPDLKSCPPEYNHYAYQKFPQAFFLDDVYLRICELSKDSLDAADIINIQNIWNGKWQTNFGSLDLRQYGNVVTGTYGDIGIIKATSTANGLKGIFTNRSKEGTFEFLLNDSNNFKGKWKWKNSLTWSSTGWDGTRK